MICEACGQITVCAPIEGAQICESCAPAFRAALAAARKDAWGRARDAHFVARDMLRRAGGTTQLMMRDVPKPVMQALKQRALDEQTTVRDLVLVAVEKYLGSIFTR